MNDEWYAKLREYFAKADTNHKNKTLLNRLLLLVRADTRALPEWESSRATKDLIKQVLTLMNQS